MLPRLRCFAHDLSSLVQVILICVRPGFELLHGLLIDVKEIGLLEVLHENLGKCLAAAATDIEGFLFLESELVVDQAFEHFVEVLIHCLEEHELIGVVSEQVETVPVIRFDKCRRLECTSRSVEINIGSYVLQTGIFVEDLPSETNKGLQLDDTMQINQRLVLQSGLSVGVLEEAKGSLIV